MSSSSSPNPQNRMPPWVLPVLVALGVPSSAVVIYQAITQHPVQALVTVLLYAFFSTFVVKVAQRLTDDWVKQIPTWIRSRWHILKFQRHYFEQLRYRYRYVPTKSSIQGRYALELRQIFISSKLALTSPNQVSSNPLKIPKVFRTGPHSLWDYLAAESLRGQPFVILGTPGSGKSTLLQDAVLTLGNRKERRQRPKVPYNLPINCLCATTKICLKIIPRFPSQMPYEHK